LNPLTIHERIVDRLRPGNRPACPEELTMKILKSIMAAVAACVLLAPAMPAAADTVADSAAIAVGNGYAVGAAAGGGDLHLNRDGWNGFLGTAGIGHAPDADSVGPLPDSTFNLDIGALTSGEGSGQK
jgi:hypothetical protein